MKQEFTGKTVEEAKELAVKELGISKDKITFTVIEEPKKGLFGKIKGEARILAEYEPTKGEIAGNYIKNILSKMGIDSEISVKEEDGGALIEIVGDTTGAVIGRRGETLDAIQYLASMVANRGDNEYYRICVDSCGYREKRKSILEELAVKISKTVIRTGRTSTLEPMNPYERRIIHSAVSNIEGVSSRSIGDEPFRKVVISSTNPVKERSQRFDRKDGKKDFKKGGRKDDFKGRGGKGEVTPRSFDMMKTSFEKDYKKPKPEDNLIEGDLYGKIDV
jgi:spoIIIJ-associated protein